MRAAPTSISNRINDLSLMDPNRKMLMNMDSEGSHNTNGILYVLFKMGNDFFYGKLDIVVLSLPIFFFIEIE
jgi:hypothetical protein